MDCIQVLLLDRVQSGLASGRHEQEIREGRKKSSALLQSSQAEPPPPAQSISSHRNPLTLFPHFVSSNLGMRTAAHFARIWVAQPSVILLTFLKAFLKITLLKSLQPNYLNRVLFPAGTLTSTKYSLFSK